MTEEERRERLRELGHGIWDHVVLLESYHIAMHAGTPTLRAEMPKRIEAEERALWGTLQTLFRGGVFPDELEEK